MIPQPRDFLIEVSAQPNNSYINLPIKSLFLNVLTPDRPLAHTSFTYQKLNMDGFSVRNGFLGYPDSTQKIFLKFLHAQGLFQTS